MFERIIQKQLSTHIEHFLSPHLRGYRKEFSTQFALISLINLIKKWRKYLDNKGYTGKVLMGLPKDFNKISHELLTAKLHTYGFSKIRYVYY